jgi:DNA ligase-1
LIYVKPEKIWELKCADLSISPMHAACCDELSDGKGIAMRFPRFLRERDDKSVENEDAVTSTAQVYEMFLGQAVQGGSAAANASKFRR